MVTPSAMYAPFPPSPFPFGFPIPSVNTLIPPIPGTTASMPPMPTLFMVTNNSINNYPLPPPIISMPPPPFNNVNRQ